MKHRRILQGKPQLKTSPFVLSYKVEIHQDYTKLQLSHLASSQYNPLGFSQAIKASHKPSLLPSGPPISLRCFSWVILLLPSVTLITYTDLTPYKTVQSSRNLVPSAWMIFLYKKIHATDSTMSLSLISTGSFLEQTCMSYL